MLQTPHDRAFYKDHHAKLYGIFVLLSLLGHSLGDQPGGPAVTALAHSVHDLVQTFDAWHQQRVGSSLTAERAEESAEEEN